MPEQQVDPKLIDETRREIGRLVSEIEELANRDLNPGEFYPEYLRRVHTALAARASALWISPGDGARMQLQFQINLQAVGIEKDDAAKQAHAGLLKYATLQSKPVLVSPNSGAGEESEVPQFKNPTSCLIVLAPIVLENEVIGIIEVFLDSDRRSTAYEGYVRFLTRIASEGTKYLKNRRLKQVLTQQKLWDRVDTYARSVHGGLIPKQVAYLIANDGRKLAECERLSVAVRRGRKTRIEAISGQDVVEKRSNLVVRMARLADRVIKHGENLIYHGTIEAHWPADIRLALERYLDESPSRLIAIVLMEDRREFGVRGKATAAILAEMIEDHSTPDELGGRLEVVARHGGLALYNALEYHRIPMLPLWRFIGNRTQWFSSNTLPKVVLGLALLVATIFFMILFPWTLRMEGRGELLPEIRRNVYAPVAGIVQDIKIDHNSLTETGSLLASIDSPELRREKMSIEGELSSAEKLEKSYVEELRKRRDNPDPDIHNKWIQQRQKIDSLKQRLKLVNDQIQSLQITSPIQGHVMDWRPKEKLYGRPVQQGDNLLQVAKVDGKWIVEVKFPESKVSHISRAMRGSPNGKLPVTFILSASPDRTYTGTLYEIATQAKPVEDENIVEGKVALNYDEELPPKVSGGEVRVKVDCGLHPVGYVLFRELIDFVREYVFF